MFVLTKVEEINENPYDISEGYTKELKRFDHRPVVGNSLVFGSLITSEIREIIEETESPYYCKFRTLNSVYTIEENL